MSVGKILKQRVSDIRPRRLNGKIVVNLARHWSSGCTNPSMLGVITTDQNGLDKQRPARCDYRSAARAHSIQKNLEFQERFQCDNE
jgi:hypothetical protein